MFGQKRLLWIAAALLVAAGVAGIAIATTQDDDESTPITGEDLSKASAAALQHTGGGTVTDSEIGDEEGYFEVEVTMPDGREIDVHLDQNFNVIGSESDQDEDN